MKRVTNDANNIYLLDFVLSSFQLRPQLERNKKGTFLKTCICYRIEIDL